MADERTRYELADGERYVIGDAAEVLESYRGEAAAVVLDDAWARPQRRQQSGLTYDLHPFDGDHDADGATVTEDTTTVEIVDACYEALVDGGWLLADADDWLLPRLVNYLRSEWGDVPATDEEGFRKIGGVTYRTEAGEPDRDTHGDSLTTGGYPVVFAHRGATERRTDVSARQITEWPTEQYAGGRVKAVEPYRRWLEGLVDPGELILVPCAGTAPAALAAKRAFGEAARFVCIDTNHDAYEAFERRYDRELRSRE